MFNNNNNKNKNVCSLCTILRNKINKIIVKYIILMIFMELKNCPKLLLKNKSSFKTAYPFQKCPTVSQKLQSKRLQ